MEENQSVYIGNIPFDYTEERVAEIAKTVGPVADLKLLFDNITGKSKGYAFVRYVDYETASSAVRNLNNFVIGNRNLKCSFSNDAKMSFANEPTERLPALPLGIQLHPQQNPLQTITQSVTSIDSTSAENILKEAKHLSIENPQLMVLLLDRYPQLSHALVELGVILKEIDPDTVNYTLNNRVPDLRNLSPEHVRLLRQVKEIPVSDLKLLDKNKQQAIEKMKKELDYGLYGDII
ncbi:uncharacterized protein KQ657_004055 [Scheffersomyces spartinae]|uniref:RRM domain-containing protein n=1 Tax=Scheffersomyces spartinae TaxID=45513 RepID=A0A9P7VCF2_9ASCO|nr:uncharacterized protein KQ657_004055 [Scheffersomyces spartinae]KAG7194946.1 hypothetical protein KQ657_004055 [Scheffersomyces spartinae]